MPSCCFAGRRAAGTSALRESGLAITRPSRSAARPQTTTTTRSPTSRSAPAAAFALFHNEGGGRFVDVTAKSGLPRQPPAAAARRAWRSALTWVDYDHDNDVDLIVPVGEPGSLVAEVPVPRPRFRWNPNPARGTRHPEPLRQVVTAPGLQVWRNNGNGTFTEVGRGARPGGRPARNVAAVGTDFNNDRAIDLVVTGGVHPLVWINPREGAFKALDWPAGRASPTVGVVVFDFDKDGWMDLAFTHAGAPGLSLWRNVEGKRVEPVTLPDLKIARAAGASRRSITTTTDGWTSSPLAGATGSTAGLLVLRNDAGPVHRRDRRRPGPAALGAEDARAPCSPATSTPTATRI